jgi:heme-degrading monooxygenase HmoA
MEIAVFVFISHLTVPAGDHEALESHFRERSRLVDGFPGFLYLQLLRPQAGTATHTFLTAWESREAFRAYMASHEHAVSHSREPAAIMERTSVRHEAYEVLMDSRGAPEWNPGTLREDESSAAAAAAYSARGA